MADSPRSRLNELSMAHGFTFSHAVAPAATAPLFASTLTVSVGGAVLLSCAGEGASKRHARRAAAEACLAHAAFRAHLAAGERGDRQTQKRARRAAEALRLQEAADRARRAAVESEERAASERWRNEFFADVNADIARDRRLQAEKIRRREAKAAQRHELKARRRRLDEQTARLEAAALAETAAERAARDAASLRLAGAGAAYIEWGRAQLPALHVARDDPAALERFAGPHVAVDCEGLRGDHPPRLLQLADAHTVAVFDYARFAGALDAFLAGKTLVFCGARDDLRALGLAGRPHVDVQPLAVRAGLFGTRPSLLKLVHALLGAGPFAKPAGKFYMAHHWAPRTLDAAHLDYAMTDALAIFRCFEALAAQ